MIKETSQLRRKMKYNFKVVCARNLYLSQKALYQCSEKYLTQIYINQYKEAS